MVIGALAAVIVFYTKLNVYVLTKQDRLNLYLDGNDPPGPPSYLPTVREGRNNRVKTHTDEFNSYGNLYISEDSDEFNEDIPEVNFDPLAPDHPEEDPLPPSADNNPEEEDLT